MNPTKEMNYDNIDKESIKEYEEIEKEWEFIWGIDSPFIPQASEVSLHTMNEISIIRSRFTKMYRINIETMYNFNDSINGPKKYVCELFDRLTEWMDENGHDTSYESCLFDVFTVSRGISGGFSSIPELYGSFKLLVKGFAYESVTQGAQ